MGVGEQSGDHGPAVQGLDLQARHAGLAGEDALQVREAAGVAATERTGAFKSSNSYGLKDVLSR
jgi:hypothetical protein